MAKILHGTDAKNVQSKLDIMGMLSSNEELYTDENIANNMGKIISLINENNGEVASALLSDREVYYKLEG